MLGDGAFQNNSNIAIGGSNADGSLLAAMGGQWATAASSNKIAIGTASLSGVMNGGTGAVAVGHQALAALTTGAGNTAVGYQAGDTYTTHGGNTVIGYQAAQASTAGNITAVGYLALEDCTSDGTVGIGHSAGKNITSGAGNVAIG